ncbi:transporter [bacterium]|nr:transporter [bacterium]
MKACSVAMGCIFAFSLYGQEPLSDNSFLVEQAYNQKPHVVQHFFTAIYTRSHKDWNFGLTQEWPLFGSQHQLSYTIPYTRIHASSENGFGDVSLIYRYQLIEHEESYSVAPRFALKLPTGDEEKGLGEGKVSYELVIPISRKWNEHWSTHLNLGVRLTPQAEVDLKKTTLTNYDVGASLIFVPRWNLNLMIEFLTQFEDHGTEYETIHTINPGIVYAYNAGSLQIVPGIAFPMQLNGHDKIKRIFFYLSFEHPF